jgi:hypothetical protein
MTNINPENLTAGLTKLKDAVAAGEGVTLTAEDAKVIVDSMAEILPLAIDGLLANLMGGGLASILSGGDIFGDFLDDEPQAPAFHADDSVWS